MKVNNKFFFNLDFIYYIEIDFVEVLENKYGFFFNLGKWKCGFCCYYCIFYLLNEKWYLMIYFQIFLIMYLCII